MKRLYRLPSLKADLVDLSSEMDLDCHPLRERIHNGGANAVETSRYLISSTAELSAGVQNGISYCLSLTYP